MKYIDDPKSNINVPTLLSRLQDKYIILHDKDGTQHVGGKKSKRTKKYKRNKKSRKSRKSRKVKRRRNNN